MRIALFTPYSPEMGGGSVQLRSHLEQMHLDVQWNYLADSPVDGEDRHYLGKQFSPAQFAFDLCARTGFLPGSTAAAKSIADNLQADLYWVVAHYEGISVAAELISQGKPVHLTVHDEPLAMLMRSRRFRPLLPAMALIFPRLLRAAQSIDVTSTVMRNYFSERYRVKSLALYRYLPKLPNVRFESTDSILTMGHIGSVYQAAPFRDFVRACAGYALSLGRTMRIVRIGNSPEIDEVASENLAPFVRHGELAEQEAVPVLAACDFVYAMYPRGIRFQGFRRTSLPIKLSTYVQAQRPIFAHTPTDSGLAKLVEKHGVGVVCSSNLEGDIQASLTRLLQGKINQSNFESMRQDIMGEEQVEKLRNLLMQAP
jgi:hypothetical protein